jgi:hypothetical protein
MGGSPQMTWYVSYVASADASADRVQRATKTFSCEGDARTFAQTRFAAGDRTLMAGTLNPATPKRLIPSAAILEWLDDSSL